MPETILQPDAARIPDDTIHRILAAVRDQDRTAEPLETKRHGGHTNDVAEVRLDDGRTLMIKRGRYDWSVPRFRTSRIASRILRQQAGIVTPVPLALPGDVDPRPIEAYWKIELPTLDDLWPELSESDRRAAMTSWGQLVRTVHAIRLPGYGPLPATRDWPNPAAGFLADDLRARLLPAVTAHWPEGRKIVDTLLRTLPALAGRLPGEGSLLHGDLHMGNVLCTRGEGGVRCVGLLDLETAQSGAPESDLARLEIVGTTLFGRPIEPRYLGWVWDGYGRTLDAGVLSFFRTYHYVNLGFHSALVGHEWHAAEVSRAARKQLRFLRSAQHSAFA